MAVNQTAERLMDLAESHMRHAGYGGFSFRDLAAEIGIKSASVHHHFPTKATMAAAVARRYADRFFAKVADSVDPDQPFRPIVITNSGDRDHGVHLA
jgi:AcrR family transcriptional regulator